MRFPAVFRRAPSQVLVAHSIEHFAPRNPHSPKLALFCRKASRRAPLSRTGSAPSIGLRQKGGRNRKRATAKRSLSGAGALDDRRAGRAAPRFRRTRRPQRKEHWAGLTGFRRTGTTVRSIAASPQQTSTVPASLRVTPELVPNTGTNTLALRTVWIGPVNGQGGCATYSISGMPSRTWTGISSTGT